jgi:hypothetical protein
VEAAAEMGEIQIHQEQMADLAEAAARLARQEHQALEELEQLVRVLMAAAAFGWAVNILLAAAAAALALLALIQRLEHPAKEVTVETGCRQALRAQLSPTQVVVVVAVGALVLKPD